MKKLNIYTTVIYYYIKIILYHRNGYSNIRKIPKKELQKEKHVW